MAHCSSAVRLAMVVGHLRWTVVGHSHWSVENAPIVVAREMGPVGSAASVSLANIDSRQDLGLCASCDGLLPRDHRPWSHSTTMPKSSVSGVPVLVLGDACGAFLRPIHRLEPI